MSEIKIPPFSDKYVTRLSVCSFIQTTDSGVLKKIRELPKKRKPWIARFGSGGGAVNVFLFGGHVGEGRQDDIDRTHLHIDLIRAIHPIGDFAAHKTTTEKIDEKISQFIGQRAFAAIHASFFIATDELPSGRGVISPAKSLEVQLDQLTLTQTSSKLKINGGPVETLEWDTKPDGKEIRVRIEVHQVLTIGSNFLVELLELLVSTFHLLVLGERKNVASSAKNIR